MLSLGVLDLNQYSEGGSPLMMMMAGELRLLISLLRLCKDSLSFSVIEEESKSLLLASRE
jgi:hypothetical protein